MSRNKLFVVILAIQVCLGVALAFVNWRLTLFMWGAGGLMGLAEWLFTKYGVVIVKRDS